MDTNRKIKNIDQKGFALLFTVLLVSITLSIAIGVSNITYKQAILSSLAKDSQIAFYQADTGAECGLYYEFTRSAFPEGSTIGDVQSSEFRELECGEEVLDFDQAASSNDYFVFRFDSYDSLPSSCFSLVFDKTGTDNIIQSYGYNICSTSHPRQVERALEVLY